MAEMTSAQRAAVNNELMREVSQDRASTGTLTKADIRAAIDALDTFLDNNATAINNAIPQPARGVLTTSQKAQLLARVVIARWVNGA